MSAKKGTPQASRNAVSSSAPLATNHSTRWYTAWKGVMPRAPPSRAKTAGATNATSSRAGRQPGDARGGERL
eukprot:scaffold217_cov377-Prasinococcus_capsulatus_cf.AAC.18